MIRDYLVNRCVGSRCPRRLKKHESEENCGERCSRGKREPRRENMSTRFCFVSQGRAYVSAQVCGRAICGRTAGQRAAEFANCFFSSATVRATPQMSLRFAGVCQIEFAVHISVE